MTIIEKLIEYIRQAAIYNRHDLAMPTVILWPDGERLWEKIIPMLLDAMPELFILDEDTCDSRRGPAPQIRYLISNRETGVIPVVYLPGVPRLSFRGFAGFPAKARHLFALQYQGQFWTQKNGRDWTPLAFLSSADGGLGLDVARDQATLLAIPEQLDSILRAKIANLQDRTIESVDIHGLVVKDPTGQLLQWMAEPDRVWTGWSVAEKSAFSATCRKTFNFDPEKDGLINAVEKLVHGEGDWEQAWERYGEAPRAYAGVRKALDMVHPKDLFDAKNYKIPENNLTLENQLRKELIALKEMPKPKAFDTLASLCKEHCPRASSIWATLGEAPLAVAVEYLNELVNAIQERMTGSDWHSLCDCYVKSGWKVDRAAWKSLASVSEKKDVEAVQVALTAVYKPWLQEISDRTDRMALSYPNTSSATCRSHTPIPGSVILFVDGLRCDLGIELAEKLHGRGLQVETNYEWAGLPTVTATAKPGWQPLAGKLIGNSISGAFEPQIADSGQSLKTLDFRKYVSELGWTWFEANALGHPGSPGWTEIGAIDHYGHDMGSKLAWRIEEELRVVIQRIFELIAHGWKEIVVITDHGWLLLPGGLPKVDLPKHLTVSRWGRAAIAQPGAVHSYKEVSWFWGNGHSIICAPGISAFREGLEYAHGGMSLQETITPVIRVLSDKTKQSPAIRILACKWKGLRLQVAIENAGDCVFDIRTKSADATTSVLSDTQKQKSVDTDGTISLVVEDDSCLGRSAVLVAVSGGKVVAKESITIGED
jgi:hypothetical protein